VVVHVDPVSTAAPEWLPERALYWEQLPFLVHDGDTVQPGQLEWQRPDGQVFTFRAMRWHLERHDWVDYLVIDAWEKIARP
jgi:hypothetical protein